jgi:anti-anti-sigma factor
VPMHEQGVRRAAVVVTLPAQIDLTSQDEAYDRVYAVFASAAPVVIADLTGAAFCDCSALRRVVQVRQRAVALRAELRLVIPPGGLVRRLAALMDIDPVLPVYSSVAEAIAAGAAAGLAAGPTRRPATTTAAIADITDLIRASHLQIARSQARLGELPRRTGAAAVPDLAATWDTIAVLIDLHMRAEEEICGPAVYRAAPRGPALAREIRDAHADIREVIAETGLQRPGSPRWQELAATALSALARHCDDEEHGPAVACFAARTWRCASGWPASGGHTGKPGSSTCTPTCRRSRRPASSVRPGRPRSGWPTPPSARCRAPARRAPATSSGSSRRSVRGSSAAGRGRRRALRVHMMARAG